MGDGAEVQENAADGRLSVTVDDGAVPGGVVFRLVGRLDIFTYLELKRQMEALMADAMGKVWLVDLGAVPFVASSGWSVLIAMRARLKPLDCRIALLGLAPNLARIHQSMNMGSMVPAFATLADARASMAF